MQRTRVLISFLLIRLRRNMQIRFSESRHCPQNLLPRSRQQSITGRSPFRQFLRDGKLLPRNHSCHSLLQGHANHQHHHDHGARSSQRPHSPRSSALPFSRGFCRNKHPHPEIRRGLCTLRDQRQQRIQSRRARAHLVQLSGAFRAASQMLLKIPCRGPRQRRFPQRIFPFFACILHFITSSKSFRAVCNRDRTVPAGIPSTAPTSAASISSTTESCSTLRSFFGKRCISLRSRSNSTCCSASFTPSTTARVSFICQTVSRASRRRCPLCRFNASRKTIRFTHPRNFSVSRNNADFWQARKNASCATSSASAALPRTL